MNNYSIYRHIFPNGKSYIGKFKGRAQRRWGTNGVRYLEKRKNGDYSQPKIAHAILKYGWDNIGHEILFTGLSSEEAIQKEIEMIAFYDSFHNGYNGTEGGDGGPKGPKSEELKKYLSELNKGKKLSEEHKQKIAVAHRGKKMPIEAVLKRLQHEVSQETRLKISASKKGKTGEQCKLSKKVIQLTKDGEFVKEWSCISEVERQLGINVQNISAVCLGKRKTAGGYKWKYKEVA